MTTRPVESRIDQVCDTCGQVDKHPRHSVSSPSGVTSHHLDCGRDGGCEVCADSLEQAPDNARHGDKLIAHLTKGM